MEIIKEIPEKIQLLWNTNLEILQMLRDWKLKYGAFVEFWDKFFTVVPPEVILLLVFTSLIMLLLNNISPTTPRINLTIGVGLFTWIYVYTSHAFTGEWRLLRVIYIDAFVLIPAYFIEIFGLAKRYWNKVRFKSLDPNSAHFQESIAQIHRAYSEMLISEGQIHTNPGRFVQSLTDLEKNIQELRTSISKVHD